MILQVLINSLVRTMILGLLAVGVTMTYDILKFANFYHAHLGVLGVYSVYFGVSLGLNLYLAIILSLILVSLVGVLLDQGILKRVRTASDVTLMIISFGVMIILENVVRAIWGPDPLHFILPIHIIKVLGARITVIQLATILVGVVSISILHFILHKTKIGKAMRAIANNPPLAQASGINTEGVIRWLWFIASSFAGMAVILYGLDTHLTPTMGFEILLPVFCAAILGGLGNPYGALLGALVVGLAENFGLYLNFAPIINLGGLFNITKVAYIPTGYKLAISFIILIIMLLFRPTGILGTKRGM